MCTRARIRNRVYRRIKNKNDDYDDGGGVIGDKLGHEFAAHLRGAWRRDVDDARKIVITLGGGTGASATPSRTNVSGHSRTLPGAASAISRARDYYVRYDNHEWTSFSPCPLKFYRNT